MDRTTKIIMVLVAAGLWLNAAVSLIRPAPPLIASSTPSGRMFRSSGRMFRSSGQMFRSSGQMFRPPGQLFRPSGQLFRPCTAAKPNYRRYDVSPFVAGSQETFLLVGEILPFQLGAPCRALGLVLAACDPAATG